MTRITMSVVLAKLLYTQLLLKAISERHGRQAVLGKNDFLFCVSQGFPEIQLVI